MPAQAVIQVFPDALDPSFRGGGILHPANYLDGVPGAGAHGAEPVPANRLTRKKF